MKEIGLISWLIYFVFILESINDYIDKEEVITKFIDLNKVEEEAFKIEDNYYGISEYDKSGNIITVHHQVERPKIDYFLK